MGEFQGKSILVIGAGELQLPVLKRAKEMGLKTIALDQNPDAVGLSFADVFLQASTMDSESALKAVESEIKKGLSVEGVLTVGTDASFTVSVIAKALSLTGIPPQSAQNATDKFAMREALQEAGVNIPQYGLAASVTTAQKLFRQLRQDCVIKPVHNMGARGVMRITDENELFSAFEEALKFSKSGKVLLEQYIEADELSIDALIFDGEIFITGVADRIIEYSPYFVETGHIMPSGLNAEKIEAAIRVFKDGCRALGLSIGAGKGDIRVTADGKAFVGEIAARLSGGYMSAYTYPLSSGVDLMENAVRIALGMPPHELEPKFSRVSIERALIAAPGEVMEISGVDQLKKVPEVQEVFFRSKVGDRISEPHNNLDKCGNIIVCAENRKDAILASHKAVQSVTISTLLQKDEYQSEEEILSEARNRLKERCHACDDCNGVWCRGKMPGVGGIASGLGFTKSVEKIRELELVPHYINSAKAIDSSMELFGREIALPVLPAPITGAVTNLGGAITELELARAIVKGANQAGTLGSVGDGATPSKFKIGLQVVLENFGMAVPFFKPRYEQDLILKRIEAAKENGAIAIGMDIDAASFLTMQRKKQATSTKTLEELTELVNAARPLPFVLKGILSSEDAKHAVKAGVSALVISNHGGRVSDALISPVDALGGIVQAMEEMESDVKLIFDGGVRSGQDVAKVIALGADAVMIGRPVMVRAVGGGVEAVREYFLKIERELKRIMALLGAKSLSELKKNPNVLRFPQS